jgi:hypothetical protein
MCASVRKDESLAGKWIIVMAMYLLTMHFWPEKQIPVVKHPLHSPDLASQDIFISCN